MAVTLRKISFFPILHYCLGAVIGRGWAVETMTPRNSQTKTFLYHNIFRAHIKNTTISH